MLKHREIFEKNVRAGYRNVKDPGDKEGRDQDTDEGVDGDILLQPQELGHPEEEEADNGKKKKKSKKKGKAAIDGELDDEQTIERVKQELGEDFDDLSDDDEDGSPEDNLDFMEMADMLQDWVSTIFSKYDKDGDGSIDRDEAMAFFKDMMSTGQNVSLTQAERDAECFAQYFDTLDFNDDGGISPEELKAFIVDVISIKELSI